MAAAPRLTGAIACGRREGHRPPAGGSSSPAPCPQASVTSGNGVPEEFLRGGDGGEAELCCLQSDCFRGTQVACRRRCDFSSF